MSVSRTGCFTALVVWLLLAGSPARSQTVVERPPEGASEYAGLWAGRVEINAVSELAAGDSAKPTPTTTPFPFQILLHIDAGGTARLLKEVVVVWKQGPDEAENREHELYADIEQLGRAGDSIVGPRLSSAGYDFHGSFLELEGRVAEATRLRGTIMVTEGLPSNPFAHLKHPEHNNLDEQLRPLPAHRAEVYTVKRDIQLEMASSGEQDSWKTLSGTFRETIHGLSSAERPIVVSGDIALRRVSRQARLVGAEGRL